MTNSSQTVTGTLTQDGFGNTVATTGSSANPYMYAATSGYRNDGDAGLMHVGARYYDAQVGRFTSRDTFLDQKPYLYCEHDPVNNTDPSGHEWKHVYPGLGTVIHHDDGSITIILDPGAGSGGTGSGGGQAGGGGNGGAGNGNGPGPYPPSGLPGAPTGRGRPINIGNTQFTPSFGGDGHPNGGRLIIGGSNGSFGGQYNEGSGGSLFGRLFF